MPYRIRAEPSSCQLRLRETGRISILSDMEQEEIQKTTKEIASLMERRLGVKGRGLRTKLRKAGSRVPAPFRQAALECLEAEKMAGNPKLRHRIDPVGYARAKHVCLSYLNNIDTTEATKRAVADYFTGLGLNVLMLGALVLAVLVWRGLL
ncbi:MAG TPA: hypothetical protein ENK83_08750 [Aliiroseovarius sp.]|nr:hypothetical protein [Aliiroseovarius sp.]